MLTFEILYAALLDLDPQYLVHLDERWRPLIEADHSYQTYQNNQNNQNNQ